MSVACRAEIASLPRILVDIRHEAAHNELPRISLLRIASKQALHWLEQRYWQQQREALKDAELQLKLKLLQYLSLLKRQRFLREEDSEQGHRGEKEQKMENSRKAAKQLFDELLELATPGISDFVSILVDQGLLEQSALLERRQCFAYVMNDIQHESSLQEPSVENDIGLNSMTDMALKDTLCRLSIFMPQLLSRLLMRITCRLLGLGAVNEGGYACLHQERRTQPLHVPEDNKEYEAISSTSALLQMEEFSRLTAWLAWLLENQHGRANEKQKLLKEKCSYTENLKKYEINGIKFIAGELPTELLQEMLSLCLKSNLDREYILELVSLISAYVEPLFREKLTRLAKFSKPFEESSALLQRISETTCIIEESGGANINNACGGLDKLKVDGQELDLLAVKERQRRLLSLAAHSHQQQGLKADISTSDSQSSGKDRFTSKDRWRLADRWFPCAIGMLPSPTCPSGVRPPWLQSCVENLCLADNKVDCPCKQSDGIMPQIGVGEKQDICLVNDTSRQPYSPNQKKAICTHVDVFESDNMQLPHKKAKVTVETFGGSGPSTTSNYDKKEHQKPVSVSVSGDESFEDDVLLEGLPKSIQGCVVQNGIFQPISLEQILALQKEICVL
ncbi:hypothetical protein O6H91_09G061400 [Diphasiastrum complanatum]|nr:hypothetical protein O6H91_09G061400 [Diphasiastrum complanatum]